MASVVLWRTQKKANLGISQKQSSGLKEGLYFLPPSAGRKTTNGAQSESLSYVLAMLFSCLTYFAPLFLDVTNMLPETNITHGMCHSTNQYGFLTMY